MRVLDPTATLAQPRQGDFEILSHFNHLQLTCGNGIASFWNLPVPFAHLLLVIPLILDWKYEQSVEVCTCGINCMSTVQYVGCGTSCFITSTT